MASIHTITSPNKNYVIHQNQQATVNANNKAKACGRVTCSATCPLFKGCRKDESPNR